MLRSLCAALAAFVLAAPAAAQQLQRNFPQSSLRAELVVVQPPDVTLNGRAARLAPGARIRDANNMLLMSASVTGQRLLVHYTLDDFGLLKDAWVLRDDEAAKLWPRTPAEAQRWAFDPLTQGWVRR